MLRWWEGVRRVGGFASDDLVVVVMVLDTVIITQGIVWLGDVIERCLSISEEQLYVTKY